MQCHQHATLLRGPLSNLRGGYGIPEPSRKSRHRIFGAMVHVLSTVSFTVKPQLVRSNVCFHFFSKGLDFLQQEQASRFVWLPRIFATHKRIRGRSSHRMIQSNLMSVPDVCARRMKEILPKFAYRYTYLLRDSRRTRRMVFVAMWIISAISFRIIDLRQPSPYLNISSWISTIA